MRPDFLGNTVAATEFPGDNINFPVTPALALGPNSAAHVHVSMRRAQQLPAGQ